MLNKQKKLDSKVDHRIAMVPHLGVVTLTLLPFTNLLPSLLVWYRYRYRSAFISRHAIEALNFNILYTVIYVLSRYFLPKEWMLPNFIIEFWMILTSIAAVFMVGRNKYFQYPLSMRLIR